MNLYLELTTFPTELAESSFVYELYKNSETMAIASGNFANKKEGDTITLLSNQILNTSKDTYTLYIYIDGNVDNPGTMAGKNFLFKLWGSGEGAIYKENVITTPDSATGSTSKFFNTEVMREEIQSLTIAEDNTVPDTPGVVSKDISQNQDGTVMLWYTPKEVTSSDGSTKTMYDMWIGGENGVLQTGTNASGMFAYLTNIEKLDLSKLDTTYITNMSRMFYNSSGLKSINLSNFNTSNVTSMNYMFSECNNLLSLDLSNFDTSKVTAMVGMFQNDTNLSSINFGSDFNTEKVTTMIAMFSLCKKLSYIDLSEFNTSNVTDMSNMFYLCYKLYNLDISGFDMSKVTKMTEMFNGASLVTIKVPSKLSEDRDTFLKEMKSGMRSGKWIDETADINYDNKASVELSEGHSYKFNPGKMYVMLNMTNTTEGKELAASVKGGAYDYTYKFIMYNPSADKWTLLSDYSSSRSYILNMKGNGERKIYVDVKDALGNVVRTSKTITLTGQEPLTVEASKNETDKQVTFTAAAAGGSSDYTYKFIVYNKTTGTWGIVQNYSDKNTCTWTKGSAGDRDFYVDVKDSDGNVVRSKAMNVKIESNKPTAVLTPSATVLSTGDKLTLTASTDKTGCTYKFLIYNPATNQWFKLQDFSSKNTCKWTAGSNGTRQFYVDVKDASGNVTRSKVVNVTIGGEGALSVKTTVSANTTKVGDKITFTAEGAGGKAGYTYKMVVYNKTTKTWGLVQNFNANNKITWTAGSAGDREFYIDVKDADGKVVRSSVMNVKTSN